MKLQSSHEVSCIAAGAELGSYEVELISEGIIEGLINVGFEGAG